MIDQLLLEIREETWCVGPFDMRNQFMTAGYHLKGAVALDNIDAVLTGKPAPSLVGVQTE